MWLEDIEALAECAVMCWSTKVGEMREAMREAAVADCALGKHAA